MAGTATGRAPRFIGRRGVVEDPDLTDLGHAHRDLVELRVVVDRVHVEEVGLHVVGGGIVRSVSQCLELLELLCVDHLGIPVAIDVEPPRAARPDRRSSGAVGSWFWIR